MCRVGSADALPAQVISDVLIQCVAPPSTMGESTEAINITFNGGSNYVQSPIHYSYYNDIVLENVRPRLVSSRRAEVVTISGSGFVNSGDLFMQILAAGKFQMRFGFLKAIRCTVPPHEISSFAIFVSNNGKDFSKSNLMLESIAPFVIASIEPHSVSSHRRATFSIKGSNFVDSMHLTCVFYRILDDASVKHYHVRAEFVSTHFVQCDHNVGEKGLIRVELSRWVGKMKQAQELWWTSWTSQVSMHLPQCMGIRIQAL